MLIKISLLLVFFAIMLAVGFISRKKVSSVDGFILGGRTMGPWLTAFSYGTSYFSAVIFVGYAGQFGWRFGVSSIWIGLGNAIIGSMLAWVILGRRTRIMTQHLSSSTMPEFFGKRYGSEGLKIISSAIIFIFLIPYTASLYNGLSRLFGMAFGIDYTVCIVAMALLTGVYVIAGGYIASSVNDFIQGIIMLAGIVAVIGAVLNLNGGFMESLRILAEVEDAAVSTVPGVFASLFGPDPLSLLGVVLLTSLGTWGLPQMVQKFYAIKSEAAIGKGAIISTVFAVIISGGCYFLGGFGRVFSHKFNVAVDGYDAIIPAMIADMTPFLVGVVVILVLSASMSTLSALVMASSSTLTLDFLKGHIVKKMDEKRQLLTIRVLIVVFIAISVVIAIIQYKQNVTFIAQLMGISWGALAGAFLAPFLYGLYWKRVSRAAVWCCFIVSPGFMIYNMLFRSTLPAILQSPINAGAFMMLLSLVLVPAVSMLTKKPDSELVGEVFSCLDSVVTVTARESIGESASGN